MSLSKANHKIFRKSLAWLVSLIILFSFVIPLPVMAENGDTGQSTIRVNLRATGLEGDIFNEDFEVQPGEINVGDFTLARHTAMGAVAAYVYDRGINIEITGGDLGLYVLQIGDNENDKGNWMYYVNESSPWVGAADYKLADGDTVHFANYALSLYSLSLVLDKEEVASGENITATVQYTDGDGKTVPATGAAVYVSDKVDDWGSPVSPGIYVGQTGADGSLTFTWNEAGFFYPYAEWNGKDTIYQWPVAAFSVPVSGPKIYTDSEIAIGDADPTLEIKLVGDEFGEGATVLNNWVINTGETNLGVGSITKVNNEKVTIAFTGTATAGTISIQAIGDALVGDANSNTIQVVVVKRISVPQQDNNWVKNGNTVLDALLTFQQADGSFWWMEDSPGVVKSATVDSLAALVDLAYGESGRHKLGREIVFDPKSKKLANAISKTIAWYRGNHNPPNSWIGMPALWACGEDLNSEPWRATQTWRETDPGFAADTTGNEHIEYIFKLLSVRLDPADVWGRNLYAELSAQQDSDSGSFGALGKHIWSIVVLDVGKELGKDVGNWKNVENRQKAINYLLGQQNEQEGSFGEFSQLDFTGWSLIALSNYMEETNVKSAVDQAVAFLRSRQQSTGGFAMGGPWGAENTNSNAAVISGLVAVGEDLMVEDVGIEVEDINTPLNITVEEGTASAYLKTTPTQVDDKKTATLPSVEVNVQTDSGTVKMEIPQGSVVSGPLGWDGAIKLPELKAPGSVNVPNASVSAVIEVGFPEGQLDFNRPVRLLLPGQAGKSVGYIRDGAALTEIDTELSTDSLEAASAELSQGEAGKIDVGDDLVVWTTHFTRFVAYTPEGGSPPSGNGGDAPSTISVTVQVIGQNATYFSGSLSLPVSQANALEALRATGLSVDTRYDDNYVYRIEDEEEDLATTSGWKYKVNGIVPDVPAKTYSVFQGDHIVWFWAADAEATDPEAGTTSTTATPLTPLEKEKFLEMITAVRELLAALSREKGEPVPLEAETAQIKVKVIGVEELMEETEKAALRELLQNNIVSISLPVDPQEDTLISDNDSIAEIFLHMEAGSLSARIEITAEEISADNLPTTPSYIPIASVYRLGPKGTVFSKPVLFSIRLAIPDDLDPAELVLAWLDEEEGQWYALPTVVDLTRGYISALLDHFTPFTVLAREEAPQAGEVVPVFNDVTMENYPWAFEAIQSLAKQKILHGVGDGKFEPARPVARAEFVAMLVKALGLEAEKGQELPFVDIEPGSWYYNAVKAAAEAEIVKGVSETAFQPNGTITREQMAVILSRTNLLAGREAKTAPAFTDAESISPWAGEGVRKVVSCGLLEGFPDGSLQPQGEVSRAQAAVVLYRLLMK